MKLRQASSPEADTYPSLLWIIGLFVAAVVTTVSVAEWQTIRHIQGIESQRTRLAIGAVFENERRQVADFANAIGEWDDEVLEDEPDSASGSYNPYKTRRIDLITSVDQIVIIDNHGRGLRTFVNGSAASDDFIPMPDTGFLRKMINAQNNPGGAITSYFGKGRDIGIASVAPIPADSGFRSMMEAGNAAYIVLIRELDADFLLDASKLVQVSGLKFGGNRGDSIHMALRGFDSRNTAMISWTAPNSALSIIVQQLPILTALAIVFVGLSVFLGRKAMTSYGRLARDARRDSLTKLPNRTSLHMAKRRGLRSGAPVSLALIDLDSFKFINDSFGHRVGDRVLKDFAAILRELAPPKCHTARMGGDEFALLIVGSDAVAAMSALTEALIARLAEPQMVEGRPMPIGCSIGIAHHDGSDMPPGELVRRADVALYAAKDSGKMCAVAYQPTLDQGLREKLQLRDALAGALVNNELKMKYQPFFDARTGEMIGVEALTRWEHPDNGPIPADVFIPIAEEFGLISAIGAQMLPAAIAVVQPMANVILSINVSARQVARHDFAANVLAAIAQTGLPPERLTVEVTETSLVSDIALAQLTLETLADAGVGIALDDFGTGYASIGFLRQLPFDSLKIDKSLIANCITDAKARAMVLACIATAKALGMKVIAEGIETEAQATLLRHAGCDYLQGWHFARALDAQAITDFHVERDRTPALIRSA
jgi:diguanylate cyclase (GGDEF)-like protein